MTNYTDVLIIGAGPTGLLLACQLAWRGVRVHIVEKNEGPSLTSKALAIQARSLELFIPIRLGLFGLHSEYGDNNR